MIEVVVSREPALDILAARLGCTASGLRILRDATGKPRLARGQHQFSISHAGALNAVALSACVPVGVDLEPVRPFPDMQSVVDEFFPETARREWTSAPESVRTRLFFDGWTRIEAALKATGRGLDHARSAPFGVQIFTHAPSPELALSAAAQTSRSVEIRWTVLETN